MGFGDRFRHLPPGIGEQAEPPGRGDGGVFLAERPGGGVAGIGEDFILGMFLGLVEGGKISAGHVDLTPDFQDCRGVL